MQGTFTTMPMPIYINGGGGGELNAAELPVVVLTLLIMGAILVAIALFVCFVIALSRKRNRYYDGVWEETLQEVADAPIAVGVILILGCVSMAVASLISLGAWVCNMVTNLLA